MQLDADHAVKQMFTGGDVESGRSPDRPCKRPTLLPAHDADAKQIDDVYQEVQAKNLSEIEDRKAAIG